MALPPAAIDRVQPTRRALLMWTSIYVTASYTETIHFFLFLFSDYLVSRELIIESWEPSWILESRCWLS
jgi:hypothetical protein